MAQNFLEAAERALLLRRDIKESRRLEDEARERYEREFGLKERAFESEQEYYDWLRESKDREFDALEGWKTKYWDLEEEARRREEEAAAAAKGFFTPLPSEYSQMGPAGIAQDVMGNFGQGARMGGMIPGLMSAAGGAMQGMQQQDAPMYGTPQEFLASPGAQALDPMVLQELMGGGYALPFEDPKQERAEWLEHVSAKESLSKSAFNIGASGGEWFEGLDRGAWEAGKAKYDKAMKPTGTGTGKKDEQVWNPITILSKVMDLSPTQIRAMALEKKPVGADVGGYQSFSVPGKFETDPLWGTQRLDAEGNPIPATKERWIPGESAGFAYEGPEWDAVREYLGDPIPDELYGQTAPEAAGTGETPEAAGTKVGGQDQYRDDAIAAYKQGADPGAMRKRLLERGLSETYVNALIDWVVVEVDAGRI